MIRGRRLLAALAVLLLVGCAGAPTASDPPTVTPWDERDPTPTASVGGSPTPSPRPRPTESPALRCVTANTTSALRSGSLTVNVEASFPDRATYDRPWLGCQVRAARAITEEWDASVRLGVLVGAPTADLDDAGRWTRNLVIESFYSTVTKVLAVHSRTISVGGRPARWLRCTVLVSDRLPVTGDVLDIVVVDFPDGTGFFMGAAPIGDAVTQAEVDRIRESLRTRR